MSGKFSNTGTTLPSQTFRHEDIIRQIVQDEVFQLLSSIKNQIESKIKSIDSNILSLKTEISKIVNDSKWIQIAGLQEKLRKIELQIRSLRCNQQNVLKNTCTKSMDQERKPIFRKEKENGFDFSGAALRLEDLQNEVSRSNRKIFAETKKQKNYSLSNVQPRIKTNSENNSDMWQVPDKRQKAKRNPILDSSDREQIHRWLTDNNRESNCFGSIIREQDIEQSIFY